MKKILSLTTIFAMSLTLSGCVEALYDTADFIGGIGKKETWKTLALEGDAEAQFKVGELYCCGERPKFDNVKALYWWCQAAKQGQRDALYNVGKMYDDAALYKGNVIPKDDVMAYTYYSLAAEHGSPEGLKNRDEIKPILNEDQIDEADELIESWPDIKCEVIR